MSDGHLNMGHPMKPTPKVAVKKQNVTLTDKQKVAALTAENLKLQRQIAKDYASRVSLENQVRALQDENKRSNLPSPSMEGLLGGKAIELLKKIRK